MATQKSNGITEKKSVGDNEKLTPSPEPDIEAVPSKEFDVTVQESKATLGSYVEVLIDPETGSIAGGSLALRGQWTNKYDFLFSCISMSVGLGNLWRFPIQAYRHGGGAFIFPYMVILVLIGCPMYFMELCIGQLTSQSQVNIWNCNPLFHGVGYATMISTLFVMSYYSSVMATIMFYSVGSFMNPLPWTCPSSTHPSCQTNNTNKSLAEIYYREDVLRKYSDIENGLGVPDWRLSLCLAATWLIVCFTLIKGVKTSGKVAYFTAIFPYVILFTLLILGATLPGAWTGLRELFVPKWKNLLIPDVWYAATCQCFFSLNVSFGSVICFGSYNKIHHNIYKDVLIICFMDTCTSLLAGITVFSVLGYLAEGNPNGIEGVLGGSTGGSEIVFISYPTALAARFGYPAPQIFSVLLFMMLFTLGIGSSAADAGAVMSVLRDRYPLLKHWMIACALCVAGFLSGLVYTTNGGQHILDLVDDFAGSFVIFFAAILEVVGIMWIYGMKNFLVDIEFMLGKKMGWHWKICWFGIIPLGLFIILILSLIEDSPRNSDKYPTSAKVCGWLIVTISFLPIFICAGLVLYKTKASTAIGKLKESISPTDDWGPLDPIIKGHWLEFKEIHEKKVIPIPPDEF